MQLSSKSAVSLRIKYKTETDKSLHTQTEIFKITKEPQMRYSFLFLYLYYQKQYTNFFKKFIGINGIELIIINYLSLTNKQITLIGPNYRLLK